MNLSALYIGLFSLMKEVEEAFNASLEEKLSALYIGLFSQQNFRYSLVYPELFTTLPRMWLKAT